MNYPNLTEENQVKDFVNENLELAARVFNDLNIDFCCGGGRTLKSACEEKGLVPGEVLEKLNQAPKASEADGGDDLDAYSLSELVDHIVTVHHKYLEKSLPRVTETLEKVIGAHGKNHPELFELKKAVGALREDLEPHMLKEENILFPMIKQLDESLDAAGAHCGPIGNPIRVMRMEHDHAGEILKRIRSLTQDFSPPADGCETFKFLYNALKELEADVHLHIHKENNLLFPEALSTVSAN
jgi:regulator of cell morphogenesis and NO signaling